MADNQTSGAPQAPSLFSAGAGASGASNARILATLEGRGASQATRSSGAASAPAAGVRPVWLALIGLLLVAAMIVWWQSGRSPTTPDTGGPAPLVVVPVNPLLGSLPAQRADTSDAQGGAAIIEDERVPQFGDAPAEGRVANPLSALAAPAPSAATAQEEAAGRLLAMIQADTATASPAPPAGPPADVRKPVAEPRAARTQTPSSGDDDAALLSALLGLGLAGGSADAVDPVATLAMRSLPGLSLSEQLGECRQLGFLRSEQCRLQVCAGQWGIAPECPTAQPGITP